MSTAKSFIEKKALVIGGSIAGLLSARILSDFFDEVLIIEKDQKSPKDLSRTGVPQGLHGHALLKSGEEILTELFPGIVDELITDGSVQSDFTRELAWNHHGSWKMKYHAGISIIQQSRPFLEWHIKRRLEMIPNVNFIYEAVAKRLLMNTEHSEVKGIEIQKEGEPITPLLADFVVDASGAGSSTANWLQLLDFEPPKKTEVRVNLFYASRIFSSLSIPKNDWGNLLVYPNPPFQNRGGSISPIENKRWMVSLLGYGVDSPPRNGEEFLQYSKNLEHPDVYEAIKDARPETDVSVYRFPSLRRFHYEKLKRFPNGLVVIGDAFCRIDPVFGQGMSIAALEAIAFKKELQKARQKNTLHQISVNTHRSFSKIIDVPWLIALTEDFRFNHTVGSKPFGIPLLKWYVKRVILACENNQHVYGRLINVLQLKAHPVSLFDPSTLKAVLLPNKR
jgi:2-polyprenyl-6-methoxyphenol hydroxylase-like FAD-dependent oxidoreductase